MTDGCFSQSYAVKPGEQYAVEVLALSKGTGNPKLIIRWKDAGGSWTQESRDIPVYFDGPKAGWRKAFGTARVPDGASRLMLLLTATPQSSDSTCWFDNVGVYRLR